MNYIKDIDTFQAEKDSVVTLGKFDGVHRGHRKLISRVLEIAEVQGLEPAVFTFDVSPQAALGIRERGLLMTNEERSRFLEELGIRLLVECLWERQEGHSGIFKRYGKISGLSGGYS